MNDDSVNGNSIAYSIKEAGQLLNLSRSTILRAIEAGELKSAKLGKQHRISRLELERFFQDKGGGPLFFEGEKANQSKERFYQYFVGDGSHPEINKGSIGALAPDVFSQKGEYVGCIEESLYRIANCAEEFMMRTDSPFMSYDCKVEAYEIMRSFRRKRISRKKRNEEAIERWQAKRKKANEQS